MTLRSTRVFTLAFIAFVLPVALFAATGTTDNSGSTLTQTGNDLTIANIITQDDAHVTVEFNQNIIPASVRLRITKQSSGENIKLDSITGSTLTPTSVDVKLTDLLEEGSSYTLTIVSAISEDGIVIKDGAQALKEFSPSIPLKRSSLITFNAPTNPNAVIVKETPPATVTPAKTIPTTVTQSGAVVKDQELPLTGTNPILFVFIALAFSFALLLKRKKA
jgi:hypothetical protein